MPSQEEISATQEAKRAKFKDELSNQELISYNDWCERCQMGEAEHCEFGVIDCRSHYAETAKPGRYTTPYRPSWDYPDYSYKPSTPVGGLGSSIPTTKAPSLPYSLNYRCPSCGHWYEGASDLADHARFACPAGPDYMGLLVVKCKCCHSLDEMAKVREGYGLKKETEVQDPGEEKV